MKIKFKNVGCTNANFEKELPCENIMEVEYDWLYRQVSKYCMSRDIDFLLNNEDRTTGKIFAGCHEIGQFELIEA